AKERRDDHGDHRDNERDEIDGELEAPCRPVRPPAVEAMEERPHLPRDRGEPAGELDLAWQAEGRWDGHRREALQRIQETAGETVEGADRRGEIAAAELARAGPVEVDARQTRDPVGERDGADEVARDDGERLHARNLGACRTASSAGSRRRSSRRSLSTRTRRSSPFRTLTRARRSTCSSSRAGTSSAWRTSTTRHS